MRGRHALAVALAAALLGGCAAQPDAEPPAAEPAARPEARALPSWRDGPSRTAILRFIDEVTRPGSPYWVPVPERIAVFDNDGTLWIEQPVYVQLAFALDRVRALAPEHPAWRTTSPYREALAGDVSAVLGGGKRGLLELVMTTHTGMTPDAFQAIAASWLETARHPRFDRPYPELVYQPMVELLELLRLHGFQTFIVSAGGVEFMRAFSEGAYGIPPQQVVGSSVKLAYEADDGAPRLVRQPELFFVDDGPAKAVGIGTFIGRRPIAAFGNSDGDLEMLEWTTAGSGLRLGALIHHTDAEREYAYDRNSQIGRLDEALDAAGPNGWLVIDMARDWSRVFPPD